MLAASPRLSWLFSRRTGGFHRTRDHNHQLINVEGLFNEVIGPLIDGRDGDFDIAMPRDDPHRDFRVVALDVFEDIDPSIALSFSQMSRIIRPGGSLFSSTIYWSESPPAAW